MGRKMIALTLGAASLVLAAPALAADRYAPPTRPGYEEPPPCGRGPGIVAGLAEGYYREGLALRVGPGMALPLITHLFNGQPLTVCAREGEWLEVIVRGWVHSRFVRPPAEFREGRN